MPALTDMITAVIEQARASEHGRHAEVLVHDGPLRQSIIALRAGERLAEHNSPPAASVHVIHGRLRISGAEPAEIAAGHLEVLTHRRHGVEALEDSVFLLTTVTSQPGTRSHGDPREA